MVLLTLQADDDRRMRTKICHSNLRGGIQGKRSPNREADQRPFAMEAPLIGLVWIIEYL
jgi:hypothetical protein